MADNSNPNLKPTTKEPNNHNKRRKSSRSASDPAILMTESDDKDNVTDLLFAQHSTVSIARQCPSLSISLKPSPCPSAAESVHSVCLVEVAPVDSRFHDSAYDSSWKQPLAEFSNRKMSTSGVLPSGKHNLKRIRKYYKAQDKLIEEFETLEQKGFRTDEENLLQENQANRTAQRLSQISFAANFLLLIIKGVAVGMSGSISLISSLVDSAVDLLSGVVIWYTSRAVRRSDPYIYPSGRKRLEPLAIVVLSVIMSLASFQLIIESVQKIVTFTSDKSGVPQFDTSTIIITSLTIVIKFSLFLTCYCVGKSRDLLTSSIGVLVQDHRNDVLSNTVALICGYFGSQEFAGETGEENVVYIDPLGAILIGAYILVSWWKTGLEQIRMLTGVSAKPEFLSKITWICLNHNPQITQIDTVRAFHFGSRFLVEVDIVLPKEMTLDTTHEIGETLQQKLESLKEVERAFVHVDWETEHRPEVEHKMG